MSDKKENVVNDQEKEEEDQQNEENQGTDDFQEYMKEMELLKSDFSDLEELDLEEIQEMRDAIMEVKEIEDDIVENNEVIEEPTLSEELQEKEAMMIDFSDLGKTDLSELIEMKQAIETVKQETMSSKGQRLESDQTRGISDELEKKIQQELSKKKKKEKKTIITEEDFLKYAEKRRDKVWYHALYYITFKVEDHTASKYLLYDVLKQDTSKSPIDPIPEHQFYFGLGYLLRLSINNTQIVRYLSGGKFKINIDIKIIKKILEDSGEPIITKPVIENGLQKTMFKDFLNDDFSDI